MVGKSRKYIPPKVYDLYFELLRQVIITIDYWFAGVFSFPFALRKCFEDRHLKKLLLLICIFILHVE